MLRHVFAQNLLSRIKRRAGENILLNGGDEKCNNSFADSLLYEKHKMISLKCKIQKKKTDALSLWHQNRAPRWTFTDLCKPEVIPGAREESASLACLAAPAMNAHHQ